MTLLAKRSGGSILLWRQYETITAVWCCRSRLHVDGGQLTYTLKLKRRVIDERYAKVIEGLYAGT